MTLLRKVLCAIGLHEWEGWIKGLGIVVSTGKGYNIRYCFHCHKQDTKND
jgi:hypothetical protein